MGITFESLVIFGLVFLSNACIATSLGDGQIWGPSDCLAVGTDVTCPWTAPPWLPSNESCEMIFRLPNGHPHGTEDFCQSIENWSRCPEETGYGCRFPYYEMEIRDSVFNSCGPDIEARINCTDGSRSPIVTINQHISTVPGPVTNLQAVAIGSSEIKVTWNRSENWRDGDTFLKYVIQYQQEYSTAVYNYSQPDDNTYHNVYFHIIKDNLNYANALTDLRVAVYAFFNPVKILSDWSTVQVRTKMAPPRQEPRNITVFEFDVNWEENRRTIHLTWEPIPDNFSGGPILRYKVTLKTHTEDRGTTNKTLVTNLNYCTLDLNPTFQYKIDIIAENPVGWSNPGEYTLDGLVFVPEKKPYYVGIAIACFVVVLILISGLFILRKKMRASHLPAITFPEKPVTINIDSSRKEQEVFDTLKPSGQHFIQNDYSSNMEKGSDSSRPMVTKSGIQLQKLDLVNELMPLTKDLEMTEGEEEGGKASPTDSGLNCDYASDMPDELSPIPVAFHPRMASTRSSEFGVFNQGETEALIATDGQQPPLTAESSTAEREQQPTDLVSSSSSSSSSSSEGCSQHDEGYSVQALASSNSDGKHGNDSLAYSQVSERPADGYVPQAVVPSRPPSANSANNAPTESHGPSSSEGSISSYVQHVGMVPTTGTEPTEGAAAVTGTSTSERSDCPTYVKQSAPSSDIV